MTKELLSTNTLDLCFRAEQAPSNRYDLSLTHHRISGIDLLCSNLRHYACAITYDQFNI